MTSKAISESAAAQTEDAEFVARIRAGDREALETVVEPVEDTPQDVLDWLDSVSDNDDDIPAV